MSLPKPLFAIGAALAAALITYSGFIWPENTFLLTGLAIYFLISFRNPFVGLCLLLFLPVLGEFSRLVLFGRSLVLSDLIIPLFEIAALLQIKNYDFSKSFSKQLHLLGIFLIVAGLSLIFSLSALPLNEVVQSSLYLIRLLLYIGLLPISYLIINKENYRQLIIFICLSTILVAGTGFLQLVLLPNLEELSKTAGYDPHINRLVGSWLDPNFIGGFFAMISVFLLGLIFYEKSTRQKTYYLITIVISLLALFLTYSRSAYLALAGGILLLGLIKARRLLVIFLILGAIGIASSDRAQQRVGELTTSINSVLFNTAENPDPTARLRIQNWDQTMHLISLKPLLGHGYNTLSYVKLAAGFIEDENIHSASGSDSSLLTILVTTGLLGLIPFLIFLFIILRDSLKAWKKSKKLATQGIGLAIFCSLISLLIHSNFVNSLFFPQIMIYLWILLGLFYQLKTNNQAQ